MAIVTLTSDLGLRDYYVASVKGLLLSHLPDANIVDITHEIEAFNIGQASFVLKSCYKDFPAGTVHIVSVDADIQMKEKFILVHSGGYFFLLPDNGLISLILEENEMQKVFELSYEPSDLVFSLKNILAPAAIGLFSGRKPEELGKETQQFVRRAHQRPVANEHIIRGSVIYIDNIGNAVTNISRQEIEHYGQGRTYHVFISRTEYFESVSRYYNEVEEGEKLCLFSSENFLEIAINKGNAGRLLGLKTGSTVLVEFI